MSERSHPAGSIRPRPPRRRIVAIAAVVVLPLAVAGFFVGAFSQADTAVERIPAAVVNSDELINQTSPDGTETPVFAGRQLITELTGSENQAFDWTITNADAAEEALAAGEVYAVLTVPSDFSASILSLQSDDPRQAELSVRTDDSHSYLTAPVIDAVGSSMAATFGTQITEQYLAGVYSGIGGLGDSLGTAADGAGDLATGAGDLGTGVGQLAGGIAASQTGASELSTGLSSYADGVGGLSDGLAQLNGGAASLTQISDGVAGYTAGVSQLSAAISALDPALASADPLVAGQARQTLTALSGQLAQVAASGPTLSSGAAGGIQSVQSGIAQSATGASRLDGGSGGLTSGASSLASGLQELSTAATTVSSGAGELATGATELSEGLRSGADQVPSMNEDAAADTAAIAADPVSLTVDRDNEVTDGGQVIATFFVPLGLWVGALALFLVLRPVSRHALASTASDGRLLRSTIVRAGAIAVAQALLLVALLHLTLGVAWSLLPATLGFSLVMALAFTAFHHLLTLAFGRAGLVVSLFILAVQVTSTGGLYPIQIVASPFQVISPLLPLTYGVSGMQSIISGANVGSAVLAVLALVGFGLASVLLALVATRRMRHARALGLLPAAA